MNKLCILCGGTGKYQLVDQPVKQCGCTLPPRPWSLGYKDRGLNRFDFAILDAEGDVVIEVGDNRLLANFLIEKANAC